MKNDPNWEAKVQAQEHVQKIKQMATDGCRTGMDPKEVAEIVINGVKENKFYLYTHPEWMMATQVRHEEILQERNPTSMMMNLLLEGSDSQL